MEDTALPPSSETAAESPAAPNDKKRNKLFKHGIAACKNYKRKLIRDWDTSIAYRRGKPFPTQSDEDRVAVNLDWSFTKMKQASLFSQVPATRVSHPPQTTSDEVAPWLHAFEQRINDLLMSAGIETAMDECLPDCINAAGIGVVSVSHETLSEMVEVPAIDLAMLPPELQAQIMQSGMLPDGTPVPMEMVPKVIDKRYFVNRVSPVDFLWPISFIGSDFDNAPWIGRTGRITWAEAQQRWNLPETEKQRFIGSDKTTQDQLNIDTERDIEDDGDEFVSFDELFYKAQKYDPSVKLFDSIRHIVFISGKDDPIIDEPWKGQEVEEESGQIIGATKFPIRVLTLSYITDEAIPPSDSAIGRPQVNEINKSRTQMILQREHSLPVRTVDVNRVDPAIMYNLMKGVWQGMIPVQGNGQNIITEVSRSAFPQENFAFNDLAMADLSRAWQTDQNSISGQVETRGEAEVIQANANTRIARERAKVGKFFTSIAEVLGGLICIYEDPASFGEGFTPQISKTLSYSILADSTVLLDSQQRLKRIEDFVNMYAKSGWVNLEPVLKEAATLSGLDPAVVIQPPQPRPPVEPNISLRLTGTEDMMNPMTLAFLMKSGQAPTPDLIEQAKKLIEVAVTPPPQPIPQLGPDGNVLPPPPDNISIPDTPTDSVGDANSEYSAMPKVNQRVLSRESE